MAIVAAISIKSPWRSEEVLAKYDPAQTTGLPICLLANLLTRRTMDNLKHHHLETMQTSTFSPTTVYSRTIVECPSADHQCGAKPDWWSFGLEFCRQDAAVAFSKYYNMVGARIEPPLSKTGRPDYSQSDTPDVAAMGTSDWSGCAPCLILEWLCSLPYFGKFVLPKARYLNCGLG